MKIVFIGASRFSLRCLSTCFDVPEVQVVGVVTAPKTFSISYRPEGVTNVLYADVSDLAKMNGVPTFFVKENMADPLLLEKVSALNPDAFIVSGWYYMIPRSWRKIAPAYGLHASLLPDYSGGAPLVWAIINGETKTGITFFQMTDGVDAGPIVGQREEYIFPEDTIATLYARVEQHGLALLREILPNMAAGNLKLLDQDESKRRVMPQRSPEDGFINWAHDANTILRFIRAQTKPYPGAYTILDGQRLHIWSADLAQPLTQGEIGVVKNNVDGMVCVCCGSGAIYLTEISYDGKRYAHEQINDFFGSMGQKFLYPTIKIN